MCFSSGPGTAPQAKSAACFGRGKQNSIRAGFRVVLFQNNPQEADILLFQQGNTGTSKEKQGPAHLWLWAARKTICREHILPIPACSRHKGRNIIPHFRIHRRQTPNFTFLLETAPSPSGNSHRSCRSGQHCPHCGLVAPLLCPPDSNQALKEDLVPFPRIFFSVQSHLSPPRSAPLIPGGIPCPEMLIRGKGTSWRAAGNHPCILSSHLPLIPAAPALIPLPWMAKSCPIYSQICSHSPSPC